MPDVFVAFYQDHYRLLLTVAQQRLGGLVDAEDITAEVFRIVWLHYQDTGEVSLPWAYQTLRNVIGNEYRRRSRAPSLTEDLVAIGATLGGPAVSDDRVMVRRGLAALSEDDRELLFMAYWEDLSHQEMSRILDCSPSALKVRLHRARRRLAKHVGEPIEESGRRLGGNG
ncbi:MAG: sigma-70 family RNA polymerase sigma factor [Actinomycetia bacterium]|nr:sigma-70 family RNA polymerase sigma factor [Actinomycetes bacterium]